MINTPITVIGAGSWGTALAIQLARNGNLATLWGRDSQQMQDMAASRYNQKYLPDIKFPNNLVIESSLKQAMDSSRVILIAVPSHAFRETLIRLQDHLPQQVGIVWATKGIDPQSNQLLHHVAREILGDVISLAVISGPSFAKEVANSMPTAVTLAANTDEFAQSLLPRFHSDYFRVYQSHDLIGVQLCGAVKNVLAIATGICDGLGFGANARCALITRGLAEMTRLGLAMGAKRETFMGLAGMGDLVLTCTDDQSRNRRFGLAVGKGADIKQAEQAIGQVVEGVGNAQQVKALAEQYDIEMPITKVVNRILENEITAQQAVEDLLKRAPTQEV